MFILFTHIHHRGFMRCSVSPWVWHLKTAGQLQKNERARGKKALGLPSLLCLPCWQHDRKRTEKLSSQQLNRKLHNGGETGPTCPCLKICHWSPAVSSAGQLRRVSWCDHKGVDFLVVAPQLWNAFLQGVHLAFISHSFQHQDLLLASACLSQLCSFYQLPFIMLLILSVLLLTVS